MSPVCPKLISESEVILSETQIRVFDYVIDLGNIEVSKRDSILADFGEDIRARAIQLGDSEEKIFFENRKFAILPNSFVEHLPNFGIAKLVSGTESKFLKILEKFGSFLGRIRFIGEFQVQFGKGKADDFCDSVHNLSKLSFDGRNNISPHLPLAQILGAQASFYNRTII